MKLPIRGRLRLLTIVILAVGIAAAILPQRTRAAGKGYIRLVHASSDAPAVDIYMDGKKNYERFPFGSYTDFIETDAQKHTIDIRASGAAAESKPFFSKQIDIAENSWSFVVAQGQLLSTDAKFSTWVSIQAITARPTVKPALKSCIYRPLRRPWMC
jgi:hypothetical protein